MSDASKLLLAIGIPLAALLLHAFYYYPYFVDDAFISLRYAERLLEGKGLTWNDGEHVEGYSNLLWVLAVAKLGWLGFDLVAAARIICLLSALAAMAALTWHNQRSGGDRRLLFLTNMAFALTAPVAIWAIGGLEATLTMALLAWAYVLALPLLGWPSKKRGAIVGLLLGLVCWTRPEGAFFTMAMAAALLLFVTYPRKQAVPMLFMLCAVPFAFFAAQVAFRLAYYGDWLPNTYYAKVAFGEARLLNGLMYVVKGLASFLPLLLVIFLQFDKLLKQEQFAAQKRMVFFLGTMGLMWLAMLTLAGGDIFAGYRHLLPVVPILMLMLHEALRIGYASGPPRHMHIFGGYLIACFFWLQCVFEENQAAKTERWEWQCREIGEWLGRTYKDTQPLVAVSNAGAIPYYSKLPSLDMLGLTDRYLTRHRSGLFGEGYVGHELFNGDYVLMRKPDIIVFYTGRKTIGIIGDFTRRADFLQQYRLATVELPDYTSEIWVRKDSGRIK